MTEDERTLDKLTRRVVQGEAAFDERRAVIMRLWEGGMTQRELAERMTRASRIVGGPEISENAVFKLIRREKAKQESVA